jgi:ribonuclease VapC
VGETCVLDSFAVLGLLGREPGGADVARLLRQARDGQVRLLISWVNLGEVAYVVERRYGERRLQQVLAMLAATELEAVPVEQTLALAAAHIKAQHAIAYADAFAAALALQSAATLVTGDPEFHLLEDIVPIHWLPRSP